MEECSRARFDYLISTTRPFNYLKRELHTRRLGSAVMMWIHTRAKGVRGHAPPKKIMVKMVRSVFFLSVPQYLIINNKNNKNGGFSIFILLPRDRIIYQARR